MMSFVIARKASTILTGCDLLGPAVHAMQQVVSAALAITLTNQRVYRVIFAAWYAPYSAKFSRAQSGSVGAGIGAVGRSGSEIEREFGMNHVRR